MILATPRTGHLLIPTHTVHSCYSYNVLTQPPDHLLNSSNKPDLLLRVGVVIAEVRDASVSLGITKVEVDCLGVADVQDSVGFRGEPRDHLAPRLLQVFLQEGHCVRCNDIALCLVVLSYM